MFKNERVALIFTERLGFAACRAARPEAAHDGKRKISVVSNEPYSEIGGSGGLSYRAAFQSDEGAR